MQLQELLKTRTQHLLLLLRRGGGQHGGGERLLSLHVNCRLQEEEKINPLDCCFQPL